MELPPSPSFLPFFLSAKGVSRAEKKIMKMEDDNDARRKGGQRERERDKSFKKKRASVWQYINMNF